MTMEQVNRLEDILITELGHVELLNNLLLAMSYDEKEEYFEYIARCFDIEWGEDEDDE